MLHNETHLPCLRGPALTCWSDDVHLLLGSLLGEDVVEELRWRRGCRCKQAHVVVIQHIHQGHKPVGLRSGGPCNVRS